VSESPRERARVYPPSFSTQPLWFGLVQYCSTNRISSIFSSLSDMYSSWLRPWSVRSSAGCGPSDVVLIPCSLHVRPRSDDPSLPSVFRINHRDFLENGARFKQVIPITNDELLSKIHQTFRMQYLRVCHLPLRLTRASALAVLLTALLLACVQDAILFRSLDDATFQTLTSLINYNHMEIVTQLQHDTAFLSSLYVSLSLSLALPRCLTASLVGCLCNAALRSSRNLI